MPAKKRTSGVDITMLAEQIQQAKDAIGRLLVAGADTSASRQHLNSLLERQAGADAAHVVEQARQQAERQQAEQAHEQTIADRASALLRSRDEHLAAVAARFAVPVARRA